MSIGSPSASPPSPSPPTNPTSLSAKKPQPVPWTHQETVHLIQAYQEKWYSLKRGQLKANQWEEVAVTVAARCGYDYNHPAKSAIQCRHKMEKLRKRYRDEKRRVSLGGAFSWQYFELMDCLERGPLPISARPLPLMTARQEKYNHINYNNNYNIDDGENNEYEEEEDQEEEEEGYGYRSKSRSINYILRKPSIVTRFAGSGSDFFQEELLKKRKREEIAATKEEEEEEEDKWGLAGEIRAFAERMVRVERKKMEMVRETERWRMEMENRRMEMILDSQRKIVDKIAHAFGS